MGVIVLIFTVFPKGCAAYEKRGGVIKGVRLPLLLNLVAFFVWTAVRHSNAAWLLALAVICESFIISFSGVVYLISSMFIG